MPEKSAAGIAAIAVKVPLKSASNIAQQASRSLCIAAIAVYVPEKSTTMLVDKVVIIEEQHASRSDCNAAIAVNVPLKSCATFAENVAILAFIVAQQASRSL